jgi:hypothetical protein
MASKISKAGNQNLRESKAKIKRESGKQRNGVSLAWQREMVIEMSMAAMAAAKLISGVI